MVKDWMIKLFGKRKTDSEYTVWENLKIYNQLDKKDISPTFKQFGALLQSLLEGYTFECTSSVIKLSRQVNQLEQAIFIEKGNGTYNLNVSTSIKPVDFYRKHKFTMLALFSLGDIMKNHRLTSFPLTKEWPELAVFLSKRIKIEIEQYFERFNSYDKIISRCKEIDYDFNNYNELLIYAAIRTKNEALLLLYLNKKLSKPVMQITYSEFLKPANNEIDEIPFLQKIKAFAEKGDFESIENEIAKMNKPNLTQQL